MKKLLHSLLLLATLGSGGALADHHGPDSLLILATEEKVLPLEEVATNMNSTVLAVAKKANVRNVIVRVDFVGKENQKRYSIRLPARVWADNALWPSRACRNNRSCLNEFGRVNALPEGWMNMPLSRGDAYFPLTNIKGMPHVSGTVAHNARLTTARVTSAVVKQAPAILPKATFVADTTPVRGVEKAKETPKPAPEVQKAPVRKSITPPSGTPEEKRENKQAYVRYELVCKPGWNGSTCLNRVAVPSTPNTQPLVASTNPVAVVPARSLEEMIAKIGNGKSPKEVLIGVRGGCNNGTCHATFNGTTTQITKEVGNAIIAQKRILLTQNTVARN